MSCFQIIQALRQLTHWNLYLWYIAFSSDTFITYKKGGGRGPMEIIIFMRYLITINRGDTPLGKKKKNPKPEKKNNIHWMEEILIQVLITDPGTCRENGIRAALLNTSGFFQIMRCWQNWLQLFTLEDKIKCPMKNVDWCLWCISLPPAFVLLN